MIFFTVHHSWYASLLIIWSIGIVLAQGVSILSLEHWATAKSLLLFKLMSSIYNHPLQSYITHFSLTSPTSVLHRHGQHLETSCQCLKAILSRRPTQSDCMYEGEHSAELFHIHQISISLKALRYECLEWCKRF